MTTIAIVKDDRGELVGLTDKDHRAWLRFRKKIRALELGEFFSFDYWFPRNPKLHRLHFKVVGTLFDAQEQFADPDALRGWLYVGAGYCDFFPGPKGRMVAIPRSVKWSKIDDADFSDLHRKVVDFMREEHAQRFLWPHLDPDQASQTVEAILYEFEREEPR
jgi:hypothetical protein